MRCFGRHIYFGKLIHLSSFPLSPLPPSEKSVKALSTFSVVVHEPPIDSTPNASRWRSAFCARSFWPSSAHSASRFWCHLCKKTFLLGVCLSLPVKLFVWLIVRLPDYRYTCVCLLVRLLSLFLTFFEKYTSHFAKSALFGAIDFESFPTEIIQETYSVQDQPTNWHSLNSRSGRIS